MENIHRRSALAFGLSAGVTPLFAFARPATAAYAADKGKELYPGVRAVELGERPSNIKAYKTISMVDLVYQPGAKTPLGEPMEHDMVCHVSDGELKIMAGDKEFSAKSGDVWSCGKGSTKEAAANSGSGVAVMRIIFLKA